MWTEERKMSVFVSQHSCDAPRLPPSLLLHLGVFALVTQIVNILFVVRFFFRALFYSFARLVDRFSPFSTGLCSMPVIARVTISWGRQRRGGNIFFGATILALNWCD